jgi:hypothetical protein
VDTAVKRVVMNELQPIREELDALKIEAKGLEANDRKHSGEHKDLTKSVERTSQNDASQDAAIAQLVVDMSAVKQGLATVQQAQETAKNERSLTSAMTHDLHDQSRKFLQRHPAVGPAVVGLLVAIANAITIWLQTRGH